MPNMWRITQEERETMSEVPEDSELTQETQEGNQTETEATEESRQDGFLGNVTLSNLCDGNEEKFQEQFNLLMQNMRNHVEYDEDATRYMVGTFAFYPESDGVGIKVKADFAIKTPPKLYKSSTTEGMIFTNISIDGEEGRGAVKEHPGQMDAFDEDAGNVGGYDELLKAAHNLVTDEGKATISLLQRSLSIGYARASKIMQQMEELEIVTPMVDGKRELLVKLEQEVMDILNGKV